MTAPGHAVEAARLLALSDTAGITAEGALAYATQALVHATLTLAAEQETANLLQAYEARLVGPGAFGDDREAARRLHAKIEARLGLQPAATGPRVDPMELLGIAGTDGAS